MKYKKPHTSLYTVEVDGSWWFYKAKNITDAICKAVRREQITEKKFASLDIRVQKGKHEHGIE